MALSPQFSISVGCDFDEFSHIQLTGEYNASTNVGGYGSPNITIGSVTSATLTITNLITEVEYDPLTITASQYYKITTFNIEDLEIDGEAAFSADDEFPDGVYQFLFTVTDGSNTYTYYKRYSIIAELRCTLASAGLKISEDTCDCDKKDFVSKYLLGYAYILSLDGIDICGDLTKFSDFYDFVENYLTTLKCNC